MLKHNVTNGGLRIYDPEDDMKDIFITADEIASLVRVDVSTSAVYSGRGYIIKTYVIVNGKINSVNDSPIDIESIVRKAVADFFKGEYS